MEAGIPSPLNDMLLSMITLSTQQQLARAVGSTRQSRMTAVCETISSMRQVRQELTGKVAFVPTMGSLHTGIDYGK